LRRGHKNENDVAQTLDPHRRIVPHMQLTLWVPTSNQHVSFTAYTDDAACGVRGVPGARRICSSGGRTSTGASRMRGRRKTPSGWSWRLLLLPSS